MKYKDILKSKIKNNSSKGLPFAPRLELWYNANKYNNTLPSMYQNASLKDICKDLNIGFHGLTPDFRDWVDLIDDVDRGLGIYRIGSMPYRIELRNIKRNISYEGGCTKVEYLTPYGSITTVTRYDEEMKQSGITIGHIVEHAFKSSSDYKALGYIFDNIEVVPTNEKLVNWIDYVGDLGIVAAYGHSYGSVMMTIQMELMPFDTFIYELMGNEDEIRILESKMKKMWYEVLEVVSNCPAEVVWTGGNYDSTLTWPPYFEKDIFPYLSEAVEIMHKKNKIVATHPDGDNKGLLKYYLDSKVDILDSLCPQPMTTHSLEEYVEFFSDKSTIWGGIPSVYMTDQTINDYDFDKYLDELFCKYSDNNKIILHIADACPPAADINRIKKIADMSNQSLNI